MQLQKTFSAKDVISNYVLETTDYQKFNFIDSNREIKENEHLKAEIEQNGILIPVIVNERFEVIDGQHRLHIASNLQIPVPYIILTGAGKEEVLSINTTSKKWSLEDYIEAYSKEGREEYQKMMVLISKYPVLPGRLCSLAFDTTDSRPVTEVKRGNLQFRDYDFLVEFLEFFKEVVEETPINNTAVLMISLYRLYRLRKFNERRIIEKSGLIAKRLRGINAQGEITNVLVECYNQKLRNDSSIIKHRLDSRGNVEFFEDMKKRLEK